MPKKARLESQIEQSARFEREAQRLIDAGELSPTAADAALDALVQREGKKAADKLRKDSR